METKANFGCVVIVPILLSLGAPLVAQNFYNLQEVSTSNLASQVARHGNTVIGLDNAGQTLEWSSANADWTVLPVPAVSWFNTALVTTRLGSAFAYVDGLGGFTFNGSAWTAAALSGAPSSFPGSAMAGLPNGDVLLFSANATVTLSETWILSGTTSTWNLLSTANSPSARDRPTLTVGASGEVYLFGGADATGFVADTWEFDGVDWNQRFPANAPPPRMLATMTHRPSTGTITLLGGYDGTPLADSWVYDGTDWAPSFVSPQAGLYVGSALDPVSDEIIAGNLQASTTTVAGASSFRSVGQGCNCAGAPFRMRITATGSPNLNQTFSINITRFESANPLFLVGDQAAASAPVQIPGLPAGCNALVPAATAFVLINPAPLGGSTQTFTQPVPGTTTLIGLGLVYQGLQLNFPGLFGCSSNALEVRLGR